KDGPFHPAATAIARDLRKIDKQRAAITFATLLRFHEQIFEIKSGSPKPGGKVMKENGKPDRRLSFKREKNLCNGFFAKQDSNKLFFGCSDLLWRALVRSQIANYLQNERDIFDACRTNLEIILTVHVPADFRSHIY